MAYLSKYSLLIRLIHIYLNAIMNMIENYSTKGERQKKWMESDDIQRLENNDNYEDGE